MAVGSSYKQPCPSCEAMVLIKDVSLVGKKVECPKCKYRFLAEKPKGKDAKAGKKFRDKSEEEPVEVEELETVEEEPVAAGDEDLPVRSGKPQVKKGAAARTKPQVKKAAAREEEEIEVEDGGDDDEDEAPRGKGKKPAAKKKAADDEDEVEAADNDEDEPEDEGKAKKKKGSNKTMLGLVLAGVGIVVIGLAGFLMFGLGGGPSKGASRPSQPLANVPNPNPPPNPTPETPPEEKKPGTAKPDVPVEPTPPENPIATFAATNEAELVGQTNLLPNDTEHVLHLFARRLFEANNPVRDASFNAPGVLDDAELRKRLGFSVLAVDDLIRAERYTAPAWAFTVLHLREPINENELKKALRLKPATSAIKNKAYYELSEPNPWLDALAQLSLGVPAQVRQLDDRPANRPTCVLIHGKQTLIIADVAPMQAFLKVDGSFKIQATRPDTPMNDPNAPPPAPMLEGTNWDGTENLPAGASKLRVEFMTGGQAKVTDAKETQMGTWQLNGADAVSIAIPGKQIYNGTIKDKTITGNASLDGKDWTWTATQETAAKGPLSAADLRSEMYLTIRPDLKAMLDKMESHASEQQVVVYSSATALDAAVVRTAVADHSIPRRPRQLWDTVLLLDESRPRLKLLGTALLARGRNFQYRNQLVCAQDPDVKEVQRDLVERVAPQVGQFLERLLGQKLELPKLDPQLAATGSNNPGPGPGGPMMPPGAPSGPGGPRMLPPGMGPGRGMRPPGFPGGPMGPGGPMPTTPAPPPAAEATASRILVAPAESPAVDFTLDLIMDQAALLRVFGLTALTAGALRAEMDLAAAAPARHELARAGRQLGAQGLSKLDVPKGSWPRGAFKRESPNRLDREPMSRLSWMAGLLPYLGNEALFERLEFKDSWRDPSNWLAARTLVPQFLDPSYPDLSRFASVPGVPVDLGATHYVGIAGVGLDAAGYRRDDAATLPKRGVLGYEDSASVAEVEKGRGLANTILMIQVPHDGVTGVSPWSAGGGATLRGVPETDSIKPFVLSTDRNGKAIQYQGKRGTYALMTDGSVRFIGETVADNVFKAMCTVNGLEKPNLNEDPNTPLVPDPKAKPVKKAPAVKPLVPVVKTEAPKEEKKAAAETKAAPKEEKKAAPKEEKKVSWRERYPGAEPVPVARLRVSAGHTCANPQAGRRNWLGAGINDEAAERGGQPALLWRRSSWNCGIVA